MNLDYITIIEANDGVILEKELRVKQLTELRDKYFSLFNCEVYELMIVAKVFLENGNTKTQRFGYRKQYADTAGLEVIPAADLKIFAQELWHKCNNEMNVLLLEIKDLNEKRGIRY